MFHIHQVDNGYIVESQGTKRQGKRVFKNNEELELLEFLGEQMLEKKVEVKEK